MPSLSGWHGLYRKYPLLGLWAGLDCDLANGLLLGRIWVVTIFSRLQHRRLIIFFRDARIMLRSAKIRFFLLIFSNLFKVTFFSQFLSRSMVRIRKDGQHFQICFCL
jgi:hypothetical protein